MIVEFKKDKIKAIAKAQILAWQVAFKGILSEKILSNLAIEDFEENWKRILNQKERKNFIWLNENEEALGFISYGAPKDRNETADFEIYGIYVHPKHWKKRIGYKLMKFAISMLKNINPSARIILWTMRKNILSQNFYNQYGFSKNGEIRISKRSNESFEEVQFEI